MTEEEDLTIKLFQNNNILSQILIRSLYPLNKSTGGNICYRLTNINEPETSFESFSTADDFSKKILKYIEKYNINNYYY